MSMESIPDFEIEQLVSRLLDRGLVPSEQQRLESLLKGNPERQKNYLDSLATHLLLEKEGALQADVEVLPIKPKATANNGKRHQVSLSPVKRIANLQNNNLRFACAAVFLIAVGGLVTLKLWPPSEPLMAKVVDSTDIVGAPTELTAEGSLIDVGLPLQFDSGLLSIKMPSGVEFVVEGPAALTVLGRNQILLGNGKLYAKVPPKGYGFRVDTEAASIVDLGTEFGVIASANGLTKSFVYQGRVEAIADNQALLVEAGMSIVASIEKGLSQPKKFKLSDVSFKNSLDGTKYVQQIKNLNPLFFHRFSSSNQRRSLRDELGQEKYNANIEGGVYVSNGGPILSPLTSDGHLRFVGVESVAEIGNATESIKETEAYTLVLWVRVDEEGPQGIAAFTNHLGPDAYLGPQLRLSEDDRLEHYCYRLPTAGSSDSKAVVQRSNLRLERGVWHHIAITGGSSRDLNLYLNGKRTADSVKMPDEMIVNCNRLLLGSGSGREGEKTNHTGPLRGAIDELVVFDRCLTAEEVRQTYKTSVNSSSMAAL